MIVMMTDLPCASVVWGLSHYYPGDQYSSCQVLRGKQLGLS